MTLQQFFTTGICDNNYVGYRLTDLDYSEDFNQPMHGKRKAYRPGYRQDAIIDFVTSLQQYIGETPLSKLPIKIYQFSSTRFEANLEQPVFRVSGYTLDNIRLYTGNIVGSLVWQDQTVSINCRFGNWFLSYMIASACGFIELEHMGALTPEAGLTEWILLYYYKLQLKKAVAKGLYKVYQPKRENLATIRGTIHTNSYLRKTYFDGRTVCDYTAHSYQNDINTVISLALQKIFSSRSWPMVADLYPIKTVFDDLNLASKVPRHPSLHKISNPYFHHYKHIAELSRKILQDEFASAGGSSALFSAFLFDISLLFEQHIRQVLQQRVALLIKEEQGRVPNGKYENELIPDILIQHCGNKISVYDVKYKHFNWIHGVERDDRFQLVTYVAACLTRYEVVECGIIYPLVAGDAGKIPSLPNNQALRVSQHTIPFRVRFYQVHEQSTEQLNFDREFGTQFKA